MRIPVLLSMLIIAIAFSGNAAAEALIFRVQVDGLACPLCAFGVEKELLKRDGVEDVAVDIEKDIILVTMSEILALDAASLESAEATVAEAVAEAGFAARSIERVVLQ